MPHLPLLSGLGIGGRRGRSGGRAVPSFGGHRAFAGARQTLRSGFFPGFQSLAHASGMTTASGLFATGAATVSAMSILAWWYLPPNITAAAQNGIVGASTLTTGNGFGLMFNASNTVKMWVTSHSTAANNATSNAIATPNGAWHFTVGTWDAGAGATTMRIFVDGGTSATDTGTLATAQSWPVAPVELGRSLSGSAVTTNYFRGYIGDVAIWNRALTSGEVSTLYNSGTPYDINLNAGLLSGLRAWWSPGNVPGEYELSPNFLDLSSGGNDLVRACVGPVDLYGPRQVPFYF